MRTEKTHIFPLLDMSIIIGFDNHAFDLKHSSLYSIISVIAVRPSWRRFIRGASKQLKVLEIKSV